MKWLILTIVPILVSCGGGGGGGGGGGDNTSPTISITSPTNNSTYTSNTTPLTIAGSASDNTGVSTVTWSSSTGDSGTCTGTTSWSANIPLTVGVNTITVTAKDNSGNTGTATLTVTYTQDTVAPRVEITSPTRRSTYISTSTPLTISGSAFDDGGVSSVTWSSSKGTSGICTLTEKSSTTYFWTASVALALGTNIITITAEDEAGNISSDTLTVTYTSNTKVTLSGTITVPSSNMVDSDVNDSNQSYTASDDSNNTITTAQSISNPVTLGGFVNCAYSGDIDGRFYQTGDVDDYFKVSLTKGDTISLYVSDYEDDTSIDLDLSIYNSDGEVVAYAVGSGGTWSITDFAYTGTYYVNAHATESASNYILSIGDQTSSEASGSLSTNKDFVPGQIIVRFKDGTTGITSKQTMATHIAGMGMKMKAGKPGKEALASMDMSKKKATFKTLGVPDDRANLIAVDTKTQKKLDTLLAIKALRKRSDVASADPNYIVHKMEVPDDTYYSYQWNLPLINLPDAWDTTKGDSSVIVAVVDTGVLLDHPDLEDKLTDDGYDFISDDSMSSDGDGVDDDPDDTGDEDNSDGTSSFHGTHVAGIIAAATNNATGIAGVNWNTLIMPVRVLGAGGGTDYDVLQGVRYSAGLTNDYDLSPDTKADIINLSLGSDTYSETEEAVYAEVRAAGVIVIAAAGNDSSTEKFYPASYDGVVSVSAVDINGDRASYSNYGSNIDVAAPGGDSGDLNGDGYADYVLSACGDDSSVKRNTDGTIKSGTIKYDYVFMAGTSMAAPHVAGVAALMKAVKSAMTPDEFDQYLASGEITDDIDDTETYGYGLIDAYKAILAAQGEVPSVLKVSPSSLNLGQSATSATLTVSQLGEDTVKVASISYNADWLTVTADSVNDNGLGTYDVVVDRSLVSSDGNYSATITFTSSSNTVEVKLKMQVNTSGTTPDAGMHYVLLVDSDTQETVAYDYYIEAENGAYQYSFSNVSQGTYEIYAGSDRDNDDYIGDSGESFGAYKSTDEPTKIVADDDISGLDFSTDYIVNLYTATGVSAGKDNYHMMSIKKVDKAEDNKP